MKIGPILAALGGGAVGLGLQQGGLGGGAMALSPLLALLLRHKNHKGDGEATPAAPAPTTGAPPTLDIPKFGTGINGGTNPDHEALARRLMQLGPQLASGPTPFGPSPALNAQLAPYGYRSY